MATYFTDDFADFPADWTEQWNTAGTWSVTSGDLDVPAGATTDWRGLSWNDIDADADRDDVEILAKLTTPTALSNALYALFVRGSGADESATNYSVRISTGALRIYYCNASDTPTQVATVAGTYTVSTTYWLRFRVVGTDLKAKVWADGGGEPGTWDLETTDATVSGAGWAGASQYSAAFAWTLHQIGVGTNGDTAPSSGSTTVTGSGTPAAQSSTVAGTATRTVTGTGTPSAQASTVAGTAEREITSSGAPTAQASTVSGTGQVGNVITGTGNPTAQSATAAGTAERSVTGSGAPSAQAATVAGTGVRTITGSGTIAANDSTVYGYDAAPAPSLDTGGGGSRRMLIRERKIREEVDEWLAKKVEQDLLRKIQREDEEIVLIMALVA